MKNMNSWLFKTLVMLLAASLVLAISAASVFAGADAYPSNPLQFIIPFSPGGSNDIVGRLIADKLTERLGKTVVVHNRPGAGGLLGVEAASKADPDGYTLLSVAFYISALYAFDPALRQSIDPAKAFAPVARLATGPLSLVVHPSVPANSVKELIALAKQKPGQLICSSAGAHSAQHLADELFKIKANIDFKIVHFKGGGPAMIDLIGGHSQLMIGSLIQTMPHIKSGKLKVLGVGGKTRSALLPHVPTIAEAGAPGYEATNWWGIVVPGDTPALIVDKLNNELKTILTSDEIKKRFLTQGAEVAYMGPTEFGSFIAGEISKWSSVVKEANIEVKK